MLKGLKSLSVILELCPKGNRNPLSCSKHGVTKCAFRKGHFARSDAWEGSKRARSGTPLDQRVKLGWSSLID